MAEVLDTSRPVEDVAASLSIKRPSGSDVEWLFSDTLCERGRGLAARERSEQEHAERAALRLARDAATVPNATTGEHFAALALHFDENQVVELVAVISLFGWLNRWNDTMATDLGDEPLGFGREHLVAQGWELGKHAHT